MVSTPRVLQYAGEGGAVQRRGLRAGYISIALTSLAFNLLAG